VDDGQAGYSESDYGWYSVSWWNSGYQADSRLANAGDGRSTAAWQQHLDPGTYTVQASWTGYHNNVSDAPYRIYDGDILRAEVRVNQKQTPPQAPDDPTPLLTLATVDITSGIVRVVLGNDATGGTLVVADAVRIVPAAILSPQEALPGDGMSGSSAPVASDGQDGPNLWKIEPSQPNGAPDHARAKRHKTLTPVEVEKNRQRFWEASSEEDIQFDLWSLLVDVPWTI
jgi:hypothetical protein